MDWTQTLTIILSMIATIAAMMFYLNNKIDNLNLSINTKFDNKIDNLSKELNLLSKELNLVKMEVLWVKFRLDPNEHPKWNQSENKEIE